METIAANSNLWNSTHPNFEGGSSLSKRYTDYKRRLPPFTKRYASKNAQSRSTVHLRYPGPAIKAGFQLYTQNYMSRIDSVTDKLYQGNFVETKEVFSEIPYSKEDIQSVTLLKILKRKFIR